MISSWIASKFLNLTTVSRKAGALGNPGLRVVLVCTVFFLGILAGCSKSPAELQKKFMAEGQHYLSEGKLNEAVIEFQNLLKVNPRSAAGHYWIGKAYLKKGWIPESILQFQTAAKLDPLMLDAHLELARYAVNSGQWQAAKPEIATILKIDPNNAEGWSLTGQRALALGHENKAQNALDHALALKPGFVPAQVAMGDLKRRQKHLNQAKDFYQKTLSSDPDSSRAWTGMGAIAQEQGKNDEALADFRKAVKVDLNNLRSHIILANFLGKRGHLHQAIAELESIPAKHADLRIPVKISEYETLLGENGKAIERLLPFERQKIQIPDIDFVLAKAYEQSGQKEAALHMVNRLLEMKSIPPIFRIGAARIELAEGNPDIANKILSSLSGTPDLPLTYWLNKSQVELALNRPERAVHILDGALKDYPGDPGALLTLADARVSQKQWGAALKTLDGLLSSDPKNTGAIFRKGTLLRKTRGAAQEIAFFQEEVRAHPDVPGLETIYLQSLAANQKTGQAIEKSKEYLAAHPDSQPVRFLLARLYGSSGKPEKSRATLKEILTKDPKYLPAIVTLGALELNAHHFPESESLFRQAIRIVPDNAKLYSGLGESLLGENQRDAATKAFRTALSYDPKEPASLIEVAKSDIISGQTQRALTHLAPLLKAPFTPQRKAEVEWLWGVAAQNNGDSGTAEKALKKAVKLDPENSAYHASMGDFWASVSQWDKASREYSLSQKLHPGNALLSIKTDWVKVQTLKGKPNTALLRKVVAETADYRKTHPGDTTTALLEAHGDLLLKKTDAALALFNNILAANPDNTPALLGKTSILLAQGHIHRAKQLVGQILIDHPDNTEGNMLLASIDQKNNDIHDEAERLEKIRQAHPDWVQPSIVLISADLSLKRFQEAKSIALSVRRAHPELSGARYLQAQAEMGLGEYRSAIRDLNILAKGAKNPGLFFSLMSVAAMHLGDKSGEKRYLDLALKSSPKDPTILNNMAFYLANNTNDLPKALEYARKAVKISPQPFIQDTLGYILFRMGNYREAEPYFKSAMDAKFRDPEFFYHMGMNEWKLGNREMASKHLRKAVVSGSLTPDEQNKAQKAIRKISSHGV